MSLRLKVLCPTCGHKSFNESLADYDLPCVFQRKFHKIKGQIQHINLSDFYSLASLIEPPKLSKCVILCRISEEE
jgi:hypothetical protein